MEPNAVVADNGHDRRHSVQVEKAGEFGQLENVSHARPHRIVSRVRVPLADVRELSDGLGRMPRDLLPQTFGTAFESAGIADAVRGRLKSDAEVDRLGLA